MLDWLLCKVVLVVGGLLCRTPPGVCVAVGQALGELAFRLQGKRVRIGVANLTAALEDRLAPGEARRIVRRIFRNLAAGLIEMLRVPAMDAAYIDTYVEIVGREHFDRAIASGRPVMFLTGHFGNWELCSITAGLKGYPIVALARAQANLPKLYDLLVSYRESKGCRIVHKGGAMRQLIQTLEAGKLVGIVGDQASRQGIFAEFFGRPALFATGPFQMAHSTGAIILPAFMARVRGPHHRLVLEAPIDLSQESGPKDAIVRSGVERFARTLEHRVAEDPAQWLWLHKRWKHTPARRVAMLSDGKLGHVKQSQLVVRALQAEQPGVQPRSLEIRYRSPAARGLALAWAWLVPGGLGAWTCLRWTLTPESYRHAATTYADIVVSAGSAIAPVNVLMSRAWRAKSIVIMNPAPLPLGAFTMAFVPAHDRVTGDGHVVRTLGALGLVDEELMRQERDHLAHHPRFHAQGGTPPAPVVAVFLGGDNEDYEVTPAFADALVAQVLEACEAGGAVCFVTTSRRTQAAVEQQVAARLQGDPRCPLLLLASRDQLNGTMTGMLGWAHVAVVTAESISMVSEACASGRHVIVVEPPRRRQTASMTKPQRLLDELARAGCVVCAAPNDVAVTVRNHLARPLPAQRLDTYAAVRQAVRRLL